MLVRNTLEDMLGRKVTLTPSDRWLPTTGGHRHCDKSRQTPQV
jgi:hypothetical protein